MSVQKEIGHPKVAEIGFCTMSSLSEGDCAGSCDVALVVLEIEEVNILVDELESSTLDDSIC